MVEATIVKTIKSYLDTVHHAGIHVSRAILFGSHARGEAHPDSDIDILVIAPEFDEPYNKKLVDLLWELRVRSDSRIEPIPVGERQWQDGLPDASAVIEIARQEGKEIALPIAA